MKRVTIIGGGPIGCYLGYLVGKKGHQVTIIEENEYIGLPVQCTGILTSQITKVLPMEPSFLVNTITKTRVFSPENEFVEFELSDNYIVSRVFFDSHFADMAKKVGAEILTKTKYLSYTPETKEVHYQNSHGEKTMKTDYLVGCDGPSSKVFTLINTKKRKYWIGLQATAKLANDNVVEFYPWIRTYAWVVPENKDLVRIGIALPDGPHAREAFKKFLRFRLGDHYQEELIGYQAGLIPEYDPTICSGKGNIFLVGDAALQVKATTGGGLVPGLFAAEACAEAIHDPTKNYQSLTKDIDKNLKAHLHMRNIIDKFSDEDWNYLVKTFQEPKLNTILKTHDRDQPLGMLLEMFIRKPSLVRFAKYIF